MARPMQASLSETLLGFARLRRRRFFHEKGEDVDSRGCVGETSVEFLLGSRDVDSLGCFGEGLGVTVGWKDGDSLGCVSEGQPLPSAPAGVKDVDSLGCVDKGQTSPSVPLQLLAALSLDAVSTEDPSPENAAENKAPESSNRVCVHSLVTVFSPSSSQIMSLDAMSTADLSPGNAAESTSPESPNAVGWKDVDATVLQPEP